MSDSPLMRLLQICTPVSESAPSEHELQKFRSLGTLAQEVVDVLATMNGFYGFESALHFFPTFSTGELSLSTGLQIGFGGTPTATARTICSSSPKMRSAARFVRKATV
jgi:hypothetical protein